MYCEQYKEMYLLSSVCAWQALHKILQPVSEQIQWTGGAGQSSVEKMNLRLYMFVSVTKI